MAYHHQESKLLLHLHLQTGCKKDAIGELSGERLRVRIKAQAIEGRANKYLIAYLAKEFGVSKSKVAIITDLHSRDKTVSIETSDSNPEWLSAISQEKACQQTL